MRIRVNNTLAGTKVSAEAGVGGAPGTRAEVALQPVVRIMGRQLCPCSTTEQVVPGRCCDPVGSPWQNLQTRGESSPHCSRLFAGLGPCGDPHCSSQFLKNCSLWEGLTMEKFVEDCVPWERPNNEAGEVSSSTSSSEEEGAAETWQQPPFPVPGCGWAGRNWRIWRVQFSLEESRSGRKGYF